MQDDKEKGPGVARLWLERIANEEKAHKTYRDRARDAQKAYDDKDSRDTYPIFWSTIELLLGAIYARTPLPDVRKRNHTNSPGADKVAMTIEQAIAYCADMGAYGASFERAVKDFLVRGLGVCKVSMRVETAMIPAVFTDPVTGQTMPLIGENGEQKTEEHIVSQLVPVEHWPASQFRWEPAPSWSKVKWICYDHFLTKKQIEKQFGVKINEKSASGKEVVLGDNEKDLDKYEKTYVVHEIWDARANKQVWISSCYESVLEINDLPLNLVGKFPTPCPMMDSPKSDDLVPDTYYRRIEKRVVRLNNLTVRINALTSAIRDVGAYDASFSEFQKMTELKDGERVPVPNLLDRINQNGSGRASFNAVVADVDNRSRVQVLSQLIEIRQREEELFFKDTGISDIVRGASNASETATAQSIKDQWANVRIGPRIKQVANYIRDVYRIVAEVIGNNFEPQQIALASGVKDLSEEDYKVIEDDFARNYVVDIETDATIAQNENAEKQQRLEALKTFTDYLNGMLPAVQNGSLPADLMKEMLLFVLSSFKAGRQLEDVVNGLPDSMQQLQSLTQNNQQLQQQLEQMQGQVQQLQKELGSANEKSSDIEAGKAGADIQLKNAQAMKTGEEAKQLAASNSIAQLIPVQGVAA